MQEFADALRASARAQGYTERTVHTVAGAHFDWSEVLASGGSLSLFADKQIVEIRIPSGKPGKDGSVALQQIAERAQGDDTTLTLVMLPRLDSTDGQGRLVRRARELRRHLSSSTPSTQRTAAVDRPAPAAAGPARGRRRGRPAHAAVFRRPGRGQPAGGAPGNPEAGPALPGAGGSDGVLGFDQVENAVLNVARYDVFKLSEAVLGGQAVRVARMLDGLQSEGESEVLVHWALAEDIRSMKRVKDAISAGRPMPMALRENRVWGIKEKLFERVLPQIGDTTAGQPAACGPQGRRHRQGPQAARLAGRRLAGAAPPGRHGVRAMRRARGPYPA